MRTLRSLGTTMSSTPLLVSFCPIRQRRPSSTPKSSIEVPCNDFKVTTTSWSLVLASKSASFWGTRRRRRRIEDVASAHNAAEDGGKQGRNRRDGGEPKQSAQEQRQACARASPTVPSLRKREGACSECGARADLRGACRAHGATIRTSPAAAGSRLPRP